MSTICKGIEINLTNKELFKLKKLQKETLETMDFLHNFFVKNNIEYSLMWGSMLGAVRHKGFIPWDDDLDLIMTLKNYLKFRKLFKESMNNEFILYDFNDKNWGMATARFVRKNTSSDILNKKFKKINQGTAIDIDILVDAPKTKRKLRWNYLKSFFCFSVMTRNVKKASSKFNFLKKIIYTAMLPIIYLTPFIFIRKILNKLFFKKYKDSNYYYVVGLSYEFPMIVNKIYNFMEKKKFDKTELMNFENRKYYVYKEYKYILNGAYGPTYNELPKLEKRALKKEL